MKCVSCNNQTKVIATISTGNDTWRVRQCVDPVCKWIVETKESIINESVTYAMKKQHREGVPVTVPCVTYFAE